ncbi:MAG: UPF0182 family protein [Firmicutes bacterium HGW-Firmicutes-15]|nr:MAG: UPF0182 family protein [Firmicutes bacterium HGW-Firmicutes-15]
MDNKSNGGLSKILVILVVLGGISSLSSYYIDWLWFKSLQFESVFTTTLLSKMALVAGMFVLTFLFFWLNLQLTKRNIRPEADRADQTEEGRKIIYLNPEITNWTQFLKGKNSKWAFMGISLLGAFMVSSSLGDQWIVVQQFIHRVSFGINDPVFNRDLGYYFFNLSFYEFIYSTLMFVLVLTVIIVGMIYLVNATTELFVLEWKQFTFAKSHLAVLVAAIFALKAWGYKLATYDVLFSAHGIVYGATYTDIYARLLANRVLLIVALLVAVMIVVNIFVKRFTWILYSIGVWIVIAVLLGGVYPTVIQKLVVQPNEFNKEKPYIEAAIKFTRQAYELDEVDNKEFNIDNNLTMQDIKNNSATIDNVRLWDWEPLQTTYKSLQELRPYYVFNDVDIDRYIVDGRYRQVMLSAREIEQNNLPAQAKTWVNQRLMYTHGYGVVMSPVTEIAQEGLPKFFIKDIPPQFSTDIKITRPEIYFGEKTNTYIMVNTVQKEFDYPMGAENVYTQYQGNNGIEIKSWPRRLLLSWVLKDYKMILSSDISNTSQVLLNRNLVDRIKKVAPYLSYDGDPYIVVNTDGKLYWMLDAYTTSTKYPYSQPFDPAGNNYIRNAVKVVCDAYTGEMSFYISDAADPIIQTYQKIFPSLFKPLADMPIGLKSHIRYPVDLFAIQAEIYRSYHMSDPGVFYNKEDNWVVPGELVGGKEKQIEPYYIVTRLPGEKEAEYILMLPYTPNGRPNMIAWMCARMDGAEYGKKLVYRFPKQETVYGPMQIESRINQDTLISSQLTLWDQKGSSALRGNLLVIPINNSILYIEPLYLQAQNSQMPELKRIIAAYGNKVVMEDTLDKALIAIFGGEQQTTTVNPATPPANAGAPASTVQELSKLARQYYDQANERLKAGDWAGYGDNINKLNDTIIKLEAITK